MLYLSNTHLLNKDICDKKNYQELIKKLNDINLKHSYIWSNIDIMTIDGLPIIGKLKDNILIGTGYNTWGLSNGFLSGNILSDIIFNKTNKYISLFSPHRKITGEFKSYLKNFSYSILGYLNGFFYNNSHNKKYKCPHMGCNLIYNEVEKTWDCPCHGSRFNKNGKCISGPANKNIDFNKKDK